MAAPLPGAHIPANLMLLTADGDAVGGSAGATLTIEQETKEYLPAAAQVWDKMITSGPTSWSVAAPQLDLLVGGIGVDTCAFSVTIGGTAINKLHTASLATTSATKDRTHNGSSCVKAYGAGGRTHTLSLTGAWTDPAGVGATAEAALETNVTSGAGPTQIVVFSFSTVSLSFTAAVTKYELTDIGNQSIEGADVGWVCEMEIKGAITVDDTGLDDGQTALWTSIYNGSGAQEMAVVVETSTVTGSRKYSGNVLPTAVTTTADAAGIAGLSFTGQGTGALTLATAA